MLLLNKVKLQKVIHFLTFILFDFSRSSALLFLLLMELLLYSFNLLKCIIREMVDISYGILGYRLTIEVSDIYMKGQATIKNCPINLFRQIFMIIHDS